jgi:small conductance mechanosensitive channel
MTKSTWVAMERAGVLLLSMLLSAFLSISVHAQSDQIAKAAQEVDTLLEELASDAERYDRLTARLGEMDGYAAEMLRFELDAHLLQMLRKTDTLAGLLSDLPDDAPPVTAFRDLLQSEMVVDEAIMARLAQLDQTVRSRLGTLQEVSGSERLLAEAGIQNLDDLRNQYLAALARRVATLEALGLANAAVRADVEGRLAARATILAGNVRLTTSTLQQLSARETGAIDQAALQETMAKVRYDREQTLNKLRSTVDMMDGLGMNTSEYKTLLIAQQGISFQALDTGAIAGLFGQWRDELGEFLSTRSGDIALNVLLFLLILLVFRSLGKWVSVLVGKGIDRSKTQKSVLLKNTVMSLTATFFTVLGLLIALDQIGISLGPMLAGLGIAGFIVGFALQDTLGNFASGAMILIYRPYDVDDVVEVAGISGSVKKMNLVSTSIATFDNQVIIVPNSKIWGDVIKNVTKQKVRRVDMEFGISYTDDIEKAEGILAAAAADHPLVLHKPETNIRVHSLGDSSVNLILRPWVKTEDYWSVYWDLMKEVKLRFDAEGVSIPFPQRDVHLYQQTPDA